MASNNYIYKMSNAGGMSTVTRYVDMLAGNTTWSPWEPAGAYDALATVTVPSGGVASIEFAGIPTGYKHLQIRSIARNVATTSGQINLTGAFNGDVTYTNYRQHYLYGNGSTALAGTVQTANSYSEMGYSTNSATAQASMVSANIVDILDYSSTTKYKTVRTLTGADWNGSGEIVFFSSLWMNTNAINSISILTNYGPTNLAAGSTFSLYGIR